MSLSFMLMLNIVLCVIGGVIFAASRVPAIRDEISMMFGGRGGSQDDGRTAHMIFLIFTYSAPLILAGIISTIFGIWRWIEGRKL